MAAKKYLIVGNWKMHRTARETAEALSHLAQRWSGARGVTLAICPPFTALTAAAKILSNGPIRLGAQNLHWEEEGAFTGEISSAMLRDLSVEYVIVGHSERRALFHEDGPTVAKKFAAAVTHGLKPILCVGETEAERESDEQKEIVKRQIREALRAAEAPENFTIAYEPIWAIGTGRTATAEDVQLMHGHIRNVLRECGVAADRIPILYGGSVKAANCTQLLNRPDVDGALVGGASLRNDEFLAIAGLAAELAKREEGVEQIES
ncbi:MAG: triose-phosphate isomerase [Puniceicoccales bacterium]|jgi:triosephosphate isomerase|nr:triose-phosphate isomerase [Puniceicoccales bacterium]